MLGGILMVVVSLVSLFLILLVLVQRGRGGGLAGAFGGMGGQSAFGTKAGDLFTRITIVVAAVWILLCVLGVKYYNTSDTFSSTLGVGAKAMPGDLMPGGPATGSPAAPATGGEIPAATPAGAPAAEVPANSDPQK